LKRDAKNLRRSSIKGRGEGKEEIMETEVEKKSQSRSTKKT